MDKKENLDVGDIPPKLPGIFTIFLVGLILAFPLRPILNIFKRYRNIVKNERTRQELEDEMYNQWNNWNQKYANNTKYSHSDSVNYETVFKSTKRTRVMHSPECSKWLRELNLPSDRLPSQEQVKIAYRSMALVLHPDVVKLSDPSRSSKTKKFSDVTIAYKNLLNLLNESETK